MYVEPKELEYAVIGRNGLLSQHYRRERLYTPTNFEFIAENYVTIITEAFIYAQSINSLDWFMYIREDLLA